MADSITTTLSRTEYLKRYMSPSTCANKLKKKKSEAATKGSGMRLLDDDTFGRHSSARDSKTRRHRPVDSDDDDDEDDEELDDIDRAIRALNRKSTTAKHKRANDNAIGPSFKTDSFVTVEGGDDSTNSPGENSKQPKQEHDSMENDLFSKTKHYDPRNMNKAIKEEIDSEGEDRIENGKVLKRQKKMDDGRKAGLVAKEAMQKEMHEMQKSKIAKASEVDESGRDAETKQRVTGFKRSKDRRHGKSGNEDDAETAARKQREAEKQSELERKYEKWNKGVSQMCEREQQLEEMQQTLAEGFTRYADDEAMNEHLKEQLHEEDPMAEYFRVKNHRIQMRTGVVYPTYKGQFPLNRFEIRPGYRWDGVDRSNGFEAKIAQEKNKKAAREELTYRSIAECE